MFYKKDLNKHLALQIFKGRCINNIAHKADHVHEIVPKSQYLGDPLVIENRCTLCQQCHEEIHATGAVNHIKSLTEKRDRFLEIYYDTKNIQQIIQQRNSKIQ